MEKKKLIEVALPLESINNAAAKEKSIRFGHPSTLHLWWARRPLAVTRAVIWASLVDDPSEHPELFPTDEVQKQERTRLFHILEKLVIWENSNNETILQQAREEIVRSTGANKIELLDPFAGGGAIPFEGQRLGLYVHAHDLNPVAVIINKAMVEIPPIFNGRPPVNPGSQELEIKSGWKGTSGLAEDVRYYGNCIKREAMKVVGDYYPAVQLPSTLGGGRARVVSWIWTRTMKCPNPACGCQVPLIKSFNLSTKTGKEASVQLEYADTKVKFNIVNKKSQQQGTISRNGAICPKCGAAIDFSYIREAGQQKKLIPKMVAVVADTKNGRVFLEPDTEQILASEIEKPEDYPSGKLSGKSRVNVSLYGYDETGDLFTNRQLKTLVTYCDILDLIEEQIKKDAIKAGFSNDHIPLEEGGSGALAYSQAVKVYLAFGISRTTNIFNSLCRWESSRAQALTLFSRQAIPMIWDFAENNPFSNAAGDLIISLDSIVRVLDQFNQTQYGEASQFNAQQDCGYRNIMISTDPPYYDNIDYADLSDFFYVWLRRMLKDVYPNLFSTMLVPKEEELVATPYRFEGNKKKAKNFFENGMLVLMIS